MENDEKTRVRAAVGAEGRTSHRHPVHENALLSVIGMSLSVHCNVLDLSLGGCRLRARDRFRAEAQTQVEVTFTIRGLPMLLPGVIQWTDCEDQFGIRFLEMSSRRKDALAELLSEIAAFHAGELAGSAGRGAAQRKTEIHVVEQPSSHPAAAQPPANLGPFESLTPTADFRERRAFPRLEVDTKAVVLLINAGGQLRGRLLDLSLSGCRVRSDERSPVSVHARVNVELLLDGVVFRLNGVIEANEDQRILRIRFEDVSDRQREQIAQLTRQTRTHDPE